MSLARFAILVFLSVVFIATPSLAGGNKGSNGLPGTDTDAGPLRLIRAETNSSANATTPSPALAPAAGVASCPWYFKGQTLNFQGCAKLKGDFYMKWNYSGGVNVTVGLEHEYEGWIALGISPTSQMVGSTVVAGYPFQGSVGADTYFLGAREKTKVLPPGPELRVVSGPQVEFQGGKMRIFFTFQLDSPSRAKSPQLIWGKGKKQDGEGKILSQHTQSDRYLGSVDLTTATGAAAASFRAALHVVILGMILALTML